MSVSAGLTLEHDKHVLRASKEEGLTKFSFQCQIYIASQCCENHCKPVLLAALQASVARIIASQCCTDHCKPVLHGPLQASVARTITKFGKMKRALGLGPIRKLNVKNTVNDKILILK